MANPNGNPNLNNLPFEELSERNRKAGIESGRVRRERKDFKNTVETLLSMPTKGGKLSDLESIKNFMDLKGKNVTVQQAIAIKLIQDALKGDKKAFELVVAMIGEQPSNKVEIDANVTKNPMSDLTSEELRKLIEQHDES